MPKGNFLIGKISVTRFGSLREAYLAPTISSIVERRGLVPSTEVSHLQLLKLIERSPGLSQRELSRELGVSLGKTHYLLRALVEKGLVKANNFRRNDNKLAYAYLLTPIGVREKLRMTRDYLRRKELEYETIVAEIEALRSELGTALRNEGYPVTDPKR